jgi:hypothetical protein
MLPRKGAYQLMNFTLNYGPVFADDPLDRCIELVERAAGPPLMNAFVALFSGHGGSRYCSPDCCWRVVEAKEFLWEASIEPDHHEEHHRSESSWDEVPRDAVQ